MASPSIIENLVLQLNRGENVIIPSDVIVYLPENISLFPLPSTHQWAVLNMPDGQQRLIVRRKPSEYASPFTPHQEKERDFHA